MNDVNEDSFDCRFLEKKIQLAVSDPRARENHSCHLRGPRARCDQRKDVNGALVAPDAYFGLVGAKSNAVDLRLIRAASQLARLLPSGGIPYADQRPSDGRRREQPPRRRHGEGCDGSVVRHDDGMRMPRRLWWRTGGDGGWRSDGDGRRTGGKVYELHMSGLSPRRRQQRRVCARGNGDDT